MVSFRLSAWKVPVSGSGLLPMGSDIQYPFALSPSHMYKWKSVQHLNCKVNSLLRWSKTIYKLLYTVLCLHEMRGHTLECELSVYKFLNIIFFITVQVSCFVLRFIILAFFVCLMAFLIYCSHTCSVNTTAKMGLFQSVHYG